MILRQWEIKGVSRRNWLQQR